MDATLTLDSDVEFICHLHAFRGCQDKSCAPPPVGPGGSHPGGGALSDVAFSDVKIAYRPRHPDGKPDPGEVVWAQVPFEEDKSRSKDRPVLIIGRTADGKNLVGVQLTSKAGHGRVPVGSGDWDRQARQSYMDTDRFIQINDDNYRREGAYVKKPKFQEIVDVLTERQNAPDVELTARLTTFHGGASHDQTSHGNWASGGPWGSFEREVRGFSNPRLRRLASALKEQAYFAAQRELNGLVDTHPDIVRAVGDALSDKVRPDWDYATEVMDAAAERFVEKFDVPEQPAVRVVEPEYSSDGTSWIIDGDPDLTFAHGVAKRVSAEDVQAVLSAAAVAKEAGGILGKVDIQISDPNGAGVTRTALGWVDMSIGNHIINLSPSLFKDYEGSKFKDPEERQMAALNRLDDIRRTVIHEMGHIQDRQMRRYGDAREHIDNLVAASEQWYRTPRMSAYGATQDVEAYAEMFAEWTATSGVTNNPAVAAYASEFGWKSWLDDVEVSIAASAGMTTDDGGVANVIYVMTPDGPVHYDATTMQIVFDGRSQTDELAATTVTFHGNHDQADHGNWSRGGRLGPKVLDDDPDRFAAPETWSSMGDVDDAVTSMLDILNNERDDGVTFEFTGYQHRPAGQFVAELGTVEVQINGPDGNKIGHVAREFIFKDGEFYGDGGHMYAASLSLDDEFQGQGIGTQIQEAFEDFAAASGFATVKVDAVDVGRYAWARAGYDFTPRAEQMDSFASWSRLIEQDAMAERFEQAAAEIREQPAGTRRFMPDIAPTPWEVAEIVGKDAMLSRGLRSGPLWEGTKPLIVREPALAAAGAPSRQTRLDRVTAAYNEWWPRYPAAAEGADDEAAEAAWADLYDVPRETAEFHGDHDQSSHGNWAGRRDGRDLWAIQGYSHGITAAAAVMTDANGQWDRHGFDNDQASIASSLLTHIQGQEVRTKTLYSGHGWRPGIEKGKMIDIPLMSATPQQSLADWYRESSEGPKRQHPMEQPIMKRILAPYGGIDGFAEAHGRDAADALMAATNAQSIEFHRPSVLFEFEDSQSIPLRDNERLVSGRFEIVGIRDSDTPGSWYRDSSDPAVFVEGRAKVATLRFVEPLPIKDPNPPEARFAAKVEFHGNHNQADHGNWARGIRLSGPAGQLQAGKIIEVSAAEAVDVLVEIGRASDDVVDLTNMSIEGHPYLFRGVEEGGRRTRATMPQIPEDHIDEFRDHLKGMGVEFAKETVDPLTLRSTQTELDATKVGQMIARMQDGTYTTGHDPWVSSDGYILDGHHRWGAMVVLEAAGETYPIMRVTRVNLPIDELLKRAEESNRIHSVARKTIEMVIRSLAAFHGNGSHDEADHGNWSDGGGPVEDDYHGTHRPTDTGPRAYDLLESEVVPTDVYDNGRFYTGYSGTELNETMRQLRAVRGNPDAQLTIYRAAPDVGTPIRPGDWVTLSRTYAQTHATSQSREDHELTVHELDVPAAAVRWAVDDLMEFGYFPDGVDELREMAAGMVEFHGGGSHDQSAHGNWAGGGAPDIDGLSKATVDGESVYVEQDHDGWRLDPQRPHKRREQVWVNDGEARLVRKPPEGTDGETPDQVIATVAHDGTPEGITAAVRQALAAPERSDAPKRSDGVLADWWDRSGDEPVWTQPRDALLSDALHEWKGSNSSLSIWMNNVENDPDYPASNGTAKIWKAQATAIIEEVRNGQPAPRLYRGDTREPSGIMGWSENLRTARRFARMNGGKVWVLTPGAANGIRVADYAPGSGLDQDEKEWIVETTPGRAQQMTARLTTFHGGGSHNEADHGNWAGGGRLELKGDKKLSPKKVLAAGQQVADDVAQFYGGTPGVVKIADWETPSNQIGKVVADEYGELMGGVARFTKDGRLLINEYDLEKMGDPELGVADFRIVAHEAVHGYVSGVPGGPLPGISQTVEEGSAELLSLNYWNERGQPFDARDLTKVVDETGKRRWTTDPTESLAQSTVYNAEVIEVARRAASKVGGWDDPQAVFAEVEAVMRQDHAGRIAWRDSTDDAFPLPDGVDTGDRTEDGVIQTGRNLVRVLLARPIDEKLTARRVEFHGSGSHDDQTHGNWADGGGGSSFRGTAAAETDRVAEKARRGVDPSEFDGPLMHRGIAIDVSPELKARIDAQLYDGADPSRPEDFNRKLELGPEIVDDLLDFEGHQGIARTGGIGQSWTTRESVAESVSPGRGGMIVVKVIARPRQSDIVLQEVDTPDGRTQWVDADGNPRERGKESDLIGGEMEVRIHGQSPLEIVDVQIQSGNRWESVWGDERGFGAGADELYRQFPHLLEELTALTVTFHGGGSHDESAHGNWAGRSSTTLTTDQMKAEVKKLTKVQQARYKALRTDSHHDAMMHALHGGSDNTGLHEATDAEREALGVPPNQRYVMVADSADGNPNGLVSRGMSGAGGIVPQYSAAHTAAQAAAKYERIVALNDVVPKLDDALARDAMTNDDAAVVAVMRATGLRVDAAGADGRLRTRSGKITYGASTLEARHVTINKDSVRFKFLGKGSKMVDVTIRDPELVKLMTQWKGDKTHSARLFDTDADRTIDYINTVTGGDFKNHDLRTYKANTIAAATVATMPKRYRSRTAMDAARRKVGTAVSKVLGNEWSTALASYVNPAIFNDWEEVTA